MFSELCAEDKRQEYLVNLEREAREMLDRLIRQMKKAEGVTEQLKSDDQMEWVHHMNSIRNRAEKVVNHELIFA